MNKNLRVLFYCKNNNIYSIDFENTTKEEIFNILSTMRGDNVNFFGNQGMTQVINLNEVVYFEIKGGN